MATIDGRPAQYGITLKQLRELMETRGREGVTKIQDYGGVQEICKKLYTSPSEGNCKQLQVNTTNKRTTVPGFSLSENLEIQTHAIKI
jgi:Ca2+ transporting ATPase